MKRDSDEHSRACNRIEAGGAALKSQYACYSYYPCVPQPVLRTITPLMFTRWLIEFAWLDTTALTARQWRECQMEGLVFGYDGTMIANERTGKLGKPLPTKRELTKMQAWLSEFFIRLGNPQNSVDVRTKAWRGVVQLVNGKLTGWTNYFPLPWTEAFKLHVYDIINNPEVRRYLRFCLNEACRRPFLANKRQVYCSVACSQRHRTLLYRSKNRELFRAKRRAYYAQKQREIIGSPNVRIQTRKGASR